MQPINADTAANWTVDSLKADTSWIVELDDRARRDLFAAVKGKRDADRPLIDYRRAEFDLGSAEKTIARAVGEVKTGRGFSILRGMPREGLTADEFELLTWAIGLHTGVARPQGKNTQYLSAVRDVGTNYRSSGGRGYSSNAELDFHTDGADIVLLTCYNVAKSGGQSMVSSSVRAHNEFAAERPDLGDILYEPYYFSRQQEAAPDEGPHYTNPIYAVEDGVLCSKWNRNRVTTAQRIEGVPPLTERQHEALNLLDNILRRPNIMYTMYLRPGDMQILNNHTTLHSRTEFEDFEEPEKKRCLFRLWLSPPKWPNLPEGWRPFYRDVAANVVRGGIRGFEYDAARREYETAAAADLGMTMGG